MSTDLLSQISKFQNNLEEDDIKNIMELEDRTSEEVSLEENEEEIVYEWE